MLNHCWSDSEEPSSRDRYGSATPSERTWLVRTDGSTLPSILAGLLDDTASGLTQAAEETRRGCDVRVTGAG